MKQVDPAEHAAVRALRADEPGLTVDLVASRVSGDRENHRVMITDARDDEGRIERALGRVIQGRGKLGGP